MPADTPKLKELRELLALLSEYEERLLPGRFHRMGMNFDAALRGVQALFLDPKTDGLTIDNMVELAALASLLLDRFDRAPEACDCTEDYWCGCPEDDGEAHPTRYWQAHPEREAPFRLRPFIPPSRVYRQETMRPRKRKIAVPEPAQAKPARKPKGLKPEIVEVRTVSRAKLLQPAPDEARRRKLLEISRRFREIAGGRGEDT